MSERKQQIDQERANLSETIESEGVRQKRKEMLGGRGGSETRKSLRARETCEKLVQCRQWLWKATTEGEGARMSQQSSLARIVVAGDGLAGR